MSLRACIHTLVLSLAYDPESRLICHLTSYVASQKRAESFGVMKIDGSGRIVDFAEKPKGAALDAMRVDTTVLGLDAQR